ncbi:hypothetical protein HOE04_01785 [archaeon]|jgi:predicted secreted protein|nr:hypothetical protein [archaeon]
MAQQAEMNKPAVGKGKEVPQKSSKMKWIIIAIVVIAVLAGLYFWLM